MKVINLLVSRQIINKKSVSIEQTFCYEVVILSASFFSFDRLDGLLLNCF